MPARRDAVTVWRWCAECRLCPRTTLSIVVLANPVALAALTAVMVLTASEEAVRREAQAGRIRGAW